MKHDLVTLVVILILKDTATVLSPFYSFSVLCLEHHYCGDQQWRSYLKVKSAKCLGLGLVILVLGLSLKNLVLFTSLM